jgi:arylsulfatase A-like enzyme
VNKHFLSPYAADVAYTPALEAFAREAVTFERHQTEAGLSGIAYASLLTGLQADRHGVYRHPQRLSEDLFLMPEAFAAAGYETFFFHGHGMANSKLLYAQGVEAKNRIPGHMSKDGRARFLAILDRLREDPDYRAFVFTNFTVTHGPYKADRLGEFLAAHPEKAPGVPEARRMALVAIYLRNLLGLQRNFRVTIERLGLSEDDAVALVTVVETLYEAGIWSLDRLFGRVMGAIRERGLLAQSLIAFTADHGEVMYRENAAFIAFTADHGEVMYRENAAFQFSHSMQLAPEVLSVPLLVAAPGMGLSPGRYAETTRSVDVFPTLLGLAGIEVRDRRQFEGIDLSPALFGREPAPALSAFSHTGLPSDRFLRHIYLSPNREAWSLVRTRFGRNDPALIWVSLREGDLNYRLRSLDGHFALEAFDLASDPAQTRDLYRTDSARHADAGERLERYKAHLVASYSHEEAKAASLPDDEEAEALRSLGYIQ